MTRKYEVYQGDDYIVILDDADHDHTENPVARVYTNKADAKIMAAAPDLLEALQHESTILVDAIKVTSSISERIFLDGIYSRMRKAINKAIG